MEVSWSAPMCRILVVDDQKDVRAMVCMVLRVNRFEVTEADSAKAALKVFSEGSFDAAVVDIFLQDACGFDVIAAMNEHVADFPIVAVSGMTSMESVSRAAEFPNVVCLQKPFRPAELIRAIETARGTRQAEASAPARLSA
jgi:DNA-binding NtrC family response regulator